uniref:Uncharacterized protein LOC110205839 isoform X2 n=1 Tax=Phascolarctos cinereus TaxID=38626 RepID=A0A6P5K087_PHACI|nr:uncharacterized protein LOC110205839 isoform X2 [Phascolarctos cinereus]
MTEREAAEGRRRDWASEGRGCGQRQQWEEPPETIWSNPLLILVAQGHTSYDVERERETEFKAQKTASRKENTNFINTGYREDLCSGEKENVMTVTPEACLATAAAHCDCSDAFLTPPKMLLVLRRVILEELTARPHSSLCCCWVSWAAPQRLD